MRPTPYILTAVLATFMLSACGNDGSSQSIENLKQTSNAGSHEHGDHGESADEEHASHGENDHSGHGDNDHDDHGEEEGADHVELSITQATEAGIVVSRAALAPMRHTTSLPAELRFDADRIAAVAPKINGRIIKLTATEGDVVKRGATLAVLSSRELADLKAQYLSSETAVELASTALVREESLFADRITSEADLQAARANLTAAIANLKGIENTLHAVGVSHDELGALSNAVDGALANIRVSAPISGVIAKRQATLGASVSADDPSAPALFTIVDDSVLWADIAVYKQNTASVKSGSKVILKSEAGTTLVEGEIATVLPSIDETSRTATARMIVENSDNRMRPGQFVTAEIITGKGDLRLLVPSSAVVTVEERASVFVPTNDGFEPRAVSIETETSGQVVVLSGLNEGEQYVSEGAFTLKAQLEKDAFGDGHAH
ncbi:efflux RND transporter periplasmic adaptor subunit [Hirschia baltica]|uniref:Efflux transporter, RND family, MFP subunit n=1 Tax=Hirschia baltica (strain ATCC 49814 / DSM 5838 / IFAM 1418) TaxID=582402 RepID=C6XPC7_HIRBI|nr:efflux RND transporter periplasmic adaptor subunit [Hirschia baltica]ACT58413.1 efflux transporter, RND family, MFP subunit [Hirschia baltica ATCC 49814]